MNLKKSLELAGKATPGPWEQSEMEPLRVQDSGRGNVVARVIGWNEPHPKEQIAVARFIAYHNPERIKEMATALQKARTEIVRLRASLMDFVNNSSDPATEARAALYTGHEWLMKYGEDSDE